MVSVVGVPPLDALLKSNGAPPTLTETTISNTTRRMTAPHVTALANCTIFGSCPTGVGANNCSTLRCNPLFSSNCARRSSNVPAKGGNFDASRPISYVDDVDEETMGVTKSDRSKSLLSNPPSSPPVLEPVDADPLIRRLRDFPLQEVAGNQTVNGYAEQIVKIEWILDNTKDLPVCIGMHDGHFMSTAAA